MAPNRRKGASKAAGAAAACRQWKVGDLVLAKLKGFPAWPAMVSEPEKWGYCAVWKKVLVYFFGTQQIAFCNPADVEAFTEEKKQFLLIKRHGKGVDFVHAVQEIVDSYEKLKKQDLLVDRFNSKQVPCTKNEKLVESSAKNGSKDYKEAHEVTLDSRLNSSYFTEGTSATVQTNAMLDKNEPLDTVVVAEIPFPSSRRRSKDICYQRSVSHKEELTVGGCRSSSRVGARRLQSSAELGKDNSKGSVIGSLKRNKQNRESPDVSESDDVYSSAFILSGIIEDNGSEIATVDSDKCSHYKGSSTDSGCKLEQSETVAECLEGDVKLNKGLDVQIKAAVIKKKRKPNRKRLTTDRSKLAGKVDNEPVMEISIHNSSETTENAHHQQELVNSSSKEDGDEHLPLVKRARVRMGKSSSAKEKLNMLSNAEESNQKLIGCPSEPIKTSFNYDIDSSADSDPFLANGALNKVSSSQVCSQSPGNGLNLLSPKEDHLFSCPSDPIKTSFNCDMDSSANRDPFLANGALNKVSSSQVCTHSLGNGRNLLSPKKDHSFSCPSEPIKMSFNCDTDSSADRDPFLANGALSKVSSSQVCTQSPGNWFNFLSPKKNHSFSCLVDGEAVLPPSKRLHRAFEAMSANTAEEGQTCTDAFSSMKTLTNSSLSSVSRCPHVNPESKTSYGLGVQDMDLVNNDAQHLSGDTTESFMEIDLHNQIDRSKVQHNESGEVVFQDAKDHQGDCENSNISDNNCTVVSVVQSQSSKQYSLSSIDRSRTDMRPPQCSVDESLPPNDESDGKTVELSNIKAENMDKEFDASEQETVMSVGPASSDVKYSLKDNTSVMPFSAEGAGCETMSLEPQLIDKGEVNDKYQLVEEFLDKQELKDPSSISFPNGHSGDGCIIRTNSCLTDGNDFLGQESPPNTLIDPMSTSDSSNYIQTNGSCSPDVHLQHKPSSCTPDDEGKFESLLAERSKSLGKNPDPHAALSSLEAMLGTLTRTKESIGRATRVAIECAKFGVASKVLEILVRSLETEASLHRRVDFFFLVDSILKGDVGGFFPSAIQAKLPRLLSAAAPPRSSAHENRRQCLKVLRLWLERRILPESIIRHHIRELDSFCGSSGAFCRRSSRTERSLDDPVREMEGMLVDEYGSNSSFQLPGFCMPRMLKDEDDGTDSDEENFEAVTPEHELRNPEEHEDRPVVIVKHRHILEDVDGELEMEDVASRCEADLASSSGGVGWSAAQISHNQFEPHDMFPFVPPLPQDIPPSSPPLPLSPPPLPLPPSVLPPCSAYTGGIDSMHYSDQHRMPDHMVQSVAQQSNTPIIYQPVSDAACYHPSECDLRGRMTEQLVRNVPQSDGTSFDNKDYPLWPPHPPPLNQFTHVQGDGHFKPWRENRPPYSKRFHSMQNGDREIYYNNHERMKPGPYEPVDSWRFPPHSFSGPWYPDQGRSYAPGSYASPPREPSRFPSQGWRYPFRSMSWRNSMHHFRPPFEGPIPATIKGPGYWRTR